MAAYRGHRTNPDKFEKSQIKIYLLILPMVLLCGLPIVFIIFHAFKPMEELFAFPPKFITTHPTLDNFRKLAKASRSAGIPISKYVFNSLFITAVVVFCSLLFSTMAAYALSKLRFKGRNVMMQINQIALMFVSVAVMIPRYLIVNKLGMIDTYLAEILPLIALPVGLFLVKQFVDQVPDSLIEAAYMDGAKEWQIYLKVIIPLIKPAIATAAILVFQQVWTNLETSNYYINDDSLKSLAFYMNTLTSTSTTNTVAGQGVAAAASLIMFLPNLILFCILQKNVMNTMAHSGIK
ncbi:carbohydrate ABC transporter permease [Butyrivibrio sp. YAB3001]|uniref:carbohydrate ABC transporter permease n=1 Tax=Butyrivibrio sp. YAB3001 TaxID=1520812 RepID=UPI0008F63A4F|nr:carbohydrate ABC transporter permease [Butyrivibrio sp. YAB3001]SFB74966.1 ABC-type glycerol-3-phosphate transport system, permease component [Butyrivibrio sp. YAB3001]